MTYTVHPSIKKFMGKTVVDTTTGFKGIVVQAIIMFNESIMFTIQPRVKKGDDSTLPESVAIDEHLVKIVKSGPSVRFLVPNIDDNKLFAMGDRVINVYSGYRGVINSAVIYLNGCIHYCVVPYFDNELLIHSEGLYFDILQLAHDLEEDDDELRAITDQLTAADAVKPEKPGEVYTPQPGGPMIRGGISR